MHGHALHHDKSVNIPVMCLREPRFLVAWNIHVSCNSLCATRGMVTREIATRAKAMYETRVGTNVQLTFVIDQGLTYKNMLNSVHKCESHTHNAFINSRINYQGIGLITHIYIRNIFNGAYYCCILL